jgi:hypothetical protein
VAVPMAVVEASVAVAVRTEAAAQVEAAASVVAAAHTEEAGEAGEAHPAQAVPGAVVAAEVEATARNTSARITRRPLRATTRVASGRIEPGAPLWTCLRLLPRCRKRQWG